MLRTLSIALAGLLIAAPALGVQDAPPADQPTEQAAAIAPEAYPVRDLRAEIRPLRRDTLEEVAGLWFNHLQRAVGDEAQAEREGDEQAITDARAAREAVAERLTLVLSSLEAKGGDVGEYRQYLTAVTAPQVSAATAANETEEAAIEPEDYPLRRLRAEVRPLQLPDLERMGVQWMGYLQQAVAEEAEAALAGSEGGSALAATEAKRNAIIERLNIVLNSIEAKGGDAGESKKYIAAVSGVQVDWFDVEAVSGYIRAWLISPDGGIKVALNIIKFIIILFLFWIIAKAVATAVRTAVRRMPKTSSLLQDFMVGITFRVVMLIGIVVALSFLGVNITPLVAAIGAAGLVIGLALQGTLSNFASGVLILVYRPYDVGDVIEAGGVSGKVEAMNLVSTRILTFDNKVQIVPNNSIWNDVITNITGRDTRRVDFTFGIAYSADIGKAMEIIEGVFKEHPLVLNEPAPNIKVNSLGDNSVNIIARPWSKTSDYWDLYWDCMRQVKERFDEAGIGIPFPQRDIHFPDSLRVLVSNEA